MNSKRKLTVITAASFVLAFGSSRPVHAAEPSDNCSLLTPAQIQKVTGSAFGAPNLTPAPPAFGQQPWGSHCTYSSRTAGHMAVDFIVYSDASPAEAKQTFERLSLWFPPKSKPAVGDSAYLDSQGAIHVLRGKTRFYISVSPRNEKQVTDLAAAVAAQM